MIARLKTSAELLVTLPVPSVPDEVPLPIWIVPPEIVVEPVYVLVLVRLNVPAPVLVRGPKLLIVPTNTVEAPFPPVIKAPVFVTLPPDTAGVPRAVVPLGGALKVTTGAVV